MNAYVAISENNPQFIWLPSPGEQYETPPPNAICWVQGATDEELLSNAREKFEGLGFTIVDASFYSPAPGGRAIHLIVDERASDTEIHVGDSTLHRQDMTQAVMHAS